MSRFGRLVCVSGPNAGQEYELNQELIVVGRASEAAVRLEDQFASRRHAEVRHIDNAYQVQDLQSKNGVSVDGRRLPGGGTGDRSRPEHDTRSGDATRRIVDVLAIHHGRCRAAADRESQNGQ